MIGHPHGAVLDIKRKKNINLFAVLILLLILVPEVVGHTLFDRPHPASSSVDAAVSLTDKIDKDYPAANFGCHLSIQNDSNAVNVTRAAGLEGKYGSYSCGTS